MADPAVKHDLEPEPHAPEVIATRIKLVRDRWGLSQTDLGTICGVGKNTVSHWEHGRQRPTVAQMHHLVQHTGLSLDWIYLGRQDGLSLATARKLGLV